MTKFQKYLKAHNSSDMAVLLNVSLRSIAAYSCGYRSPRQRDLLKLVAASNGDLKLADFFEDAE